VYSTWLEPGYFSLDGLTFEQQEWKSVPWH